MLAAHGATCDMFVFGADRKLRVYNPKVGTERKLREVQRLQPQLLENEFIQATPGFWDKPLDTQAQLVSDALGEQPLDLPYEVVEMRLHSTASLLALVGTHRVAVVVLPAGGRVLADEDTPNEVGELLARLGLQEYSEQFAEARYESTSQLYQMNPPEREQLKRDVNMKPGHAHTLTMHLDGRLPLAQQAVSSRAEAPAERCWAVMVATPPTLWVARGQAWSTMSKDDDSI